MTAESGRIPLVVLISGGGTNLQALIDAAVSAGSRYYIRAVICNVPGARGLQRATDAGIQTRVIDHTDYAERETFDTELGDAIDGFAPTLVVLAGFMRIMTPSLVERFAGRMINIHPSLLPDFQGLHTHRRALAAGVEEHGASVHFVTAELDGGPVIAQSRVAVIEGDDEQRLAARVLEHEHRLLPQVVDWFARGRVRLDGGQVMFDDAPIDAPLSC